MAFGPSCMQLLGCLSPVNLAVSRPLCGGFDAGPAHGSDRRPYVSTAPRVTQRPSPFPGNGKRTPSSVVFSCVLHLASCCCTAAAAAAVFFFFPSFFQGWRSVYVNEPGEVLAWCTHQPTNLTWRIKQVLRWHQGAVQLLYTKVGAIIDKAACFPQLCVCITPSPFCLRLSRFVALVTKRLPHLSVLCLTTLL